MTNYWPWHKPRKQATFCQNNHPPPSTALLCSSCVTARLHRRRFQRLQSSTRLTSLTGRTDQPIRMVNRPKSRFLVFGTAKAEKCTFNIITTTTSLLPRFFHRCRVLCRFLSYSILSVAVTSDSIGRRSNNLPPEHAELCPRLLLFDRGKGTYHHYRYRNCVCADPARFPPLLALLSCAIDWLGLFA